MIPTLIFVGIAVGAISRRWPNRPAAVVVVCAVIALIWGVMVGEGGFGQIGGGALLALVNLAIGFGIAVGIQWTLDRAGDGPIGGR